jgi:hypothetical protein
MTFSSPAEKRPLQGQLLVIGIFNIFCLKTVVQNRLLVTIEAFILSLT